MEDLNGKKKRNTILYLAGISIFTFNQFDFVQFEGNLTRHHLTRKVGAMGIIIEADYAGNTHYICRVPMLSGR